MSVVAAEQFIGAQQAADNAQRRGIANHRAGDRSGISFGGANFVHLDGRVADRAFEPNRKDHAGAGNPGLRRQRQGQGFLAQIDGAARRSW